MAVRNEQQNTPQGTFGRIQAAGLMPIVVFGALSILFGLALGVWVVNGTSILPPQASLQAQRTDGLFAILMTLGGVVFFLVQGLLYYAAVRFRAKPNDISDGPSIHGNTMLEIVWTVIPSIIVVVLAIASFWVWRENTELSPTPNLVNGESIAVNAYGQRYAWSFEYMTNEENINGEQIVLNSPELHVYAGQDVELDMQTRDVIHSFWVPAMRVKQDLLPGRTTSVVFSPIETDEGWEFASIASPTVIYAEPDRTASAVFTQDDPEADPTRVELVNPTEAIAGDWVEVIAPNGNTGYVVAADVLGRHNRYRLICTELCGGGHGNMYSWLVMHENEEAMLASWYDVQAAKQFEPAADPLVLGEQVLSSGRYPCANCHVLESMGWNGNLGPSLEGIGSRAASRAQAAGNMSGADYLAASIRRPNQYIVAGYNAGIMSYFGNTAEAPPGVSGSYQQMSDEDLAGIIAYLCAETVSGDPADNTCGLDGFVFENDAFVDTDVVVSALTDVIDDYQE